MAHSKQQLKPSPVRQQKAAAKAKANQMKTGTVGSQLKKSISGAMGNTHRVG